MENYCTEISIFMNYKKEAEDRVWQVRMFKDYFFYFRTFDRNF